MRQFGTLVLACCVLLLTMTACQSTAGRPLNKDAGFREDEAISVRHKYAAYISLDAYMEQPLQKVLDYYFDKFGSENELVMKENDHIYTGTMLEIKEGYKVKDWGRLAMEEPPIAGVDDAVISLYPKLRQLMETMEEADSYYKLKSYVDDDLAKGRTLHEQIYILSQEVNDSRNKFVATLERELAEYRQLELEYMQMNDFMIQQTALEFVVAAEDIGTYLKQHGASADNLAELDLQEYKVLYDRMVASLENYLSYCDDRERIKQEGLESYDHNVNYLKHTIMHVKASATDLLMRLQDAKQDVHQGTNKEQAGVAYTFDKYDKEGTPKYYLSALSKLKLEYSNFMLSY